MSELRGTTKGIPSRQTTRNVACWSPLGKGLPHGQCNGWSPSSAGMTRIEGHSAAVASPACVLPCGAWTGQTVRQNDSQPSLSAWLPPDPLRLLAAGVLAAPDPLLELDIVCISAVSSEVVEEPTSLLSVSEVVSSGCCEAVSSGCCAACAAATASLANRRCHRSLNFFRDLCWLSCFAAILASRSAFFVGSARDLRRWGL